MSFRITGYIKVAGYKPFTFSSASGERDITNYADSAKFIIPALCRLKSTNGNYIGNDLQTGLQFNEGDQVSIAGGYDERNIVRFMGYIKRINFKIPLEVECEGYSYALRKVRFTKSYTSQTTVKQVLSDLISGTVIKLSDQIPDIPFEPFPFKNYSGTDVLDFLKKEYLLTTFFLFDTLYVGLQQTIWDGAQSRTVTHVLGWNVIKDDQLLFSAQKEFAQVNVTLKSLNPDGTRNKCTNRLLSPANEKIVKTLVRDQGWLEKIRQEQQTMTNNAGYTGSITGFLEPYVEPGMASNIQDEDYADRTGLYFIPSVKWSIKPTGGGRQIIGIGNNL